MAKSATSHVTSVRLPEEVLRSVQALATVMDQSPNSIIVDAIRAHVRSVVGSAEYVAARDAQQRRISENAAFLEDFHGRSRTVPLAAVPGR